MRLSYFERHLDHINASSVLIDKDSFVFKDFYFMYKGFEFLLHSYIGNRIYTVFPYYQSQEYNIGMSKHLKRMLFWTMQQAFQKGKNQVEKIVNFFFKAYLRELHSEHSQTFNSLSANPTKWSNTLKQFVGSCLSVFNHFLGLAFKGLRQIFLRKQLTTESNELFLQKTLP